MHLRHLGTHGVNTTELTRGYYLIRRVTMRCPKCRGKMFAEKYYDFVRSFDAWKCTCCGELLDSTIIANRAKMLNS